MRGGTGKRQRPYDGSKSAGYKGKGDGRPGGRDGRPGSRDGRPGGRDSRPGNRDGRPGGRDGRSGGRDNRYGSRDNRSGGYNGYRKGPGGPGGRDGRPDKRRTSSSLIEGRRAAAEALDVHVPIKRALVAKSGGDRSLDQLIGRLEAEGIHVEYVGRDRLDAKSAHGAHQGIMLEVEPYHYAELNDIIEAAGDDNALVILLDHVTDEGNFGAIVRTAEVVGAAGVIVANARAARVGTAVYKTSAGAVLHVPIAQVANLATAIDTLKEEGFWVGAATEHATDSVWDAPLEGRVCLVMGSEGSGVSALVRKKCDFECKLPQRGRVESLNVAQATTAICYEWLRREMMQGKDQS